MTRTEPADGTPKDRQAGIPADPSVDVDLVAAETHDDVEGDTYFWSSPPPPSKVPQPRVKADMLRGAAQYQAHNAAARREAAARAEAAAAATAGIPIPTPAPAPAPAPVVPVAPPPPPPPPPPLVEVAPPPPPPPAPVVVVAAPRPPAPVVPLETPETFESLAARPPLQGTAAPMHLEPTPFPARHEPHPQPAEPGVDGESYILARRNSFSSYWGASAQPTAAEPANEARNPPPASVPTPTPAPVLEPSPAPTWSATAEPPRSVRVAVARAKKAARRKRMIAASLVAAGAVLVLISVTTLGLFGGSSGGASKPSPSNTVTLSKNGFGSCQVNGPLPAGAAATPCKFTVRYSGAVAAYLGLDVLIETQAGAGGTNLYNPGDPGHGLQVTITSAAPRATFTTPVAATACPSGVPSHTTCYALDNQLVATSPFGSTAAINYTVQLIPPASSASGYQGGTAQIILNTHAVKAQNNPLACTAISPSVDPPTAGKPCTPAGSFKWATN